MSDVDFLDSNIIVYALDADSGAKGEVAARLLNTALRENNAVISFQVVQETLNVLGKFEKKLSPPDRLAVLNEVLAPLWRVFPSATLYARALDVQERYQFGFYDSLIVAAALEAGCARLLTEDLQDGQKIESLTIANPFRE
ncbi:MAG: PIN domain-containing protein [Azoarcus sp.]|jgi:predicted nucleic acid-binding protein|nr:PIN domain-containing protein [Azoarcus sp.]